MLRSRLFSAAAGTALLLAGPLGAPLLANSLVAKGQTALVAKSTLSVTPDREWNKLSGRPGRNSESWTIDGTQLNDLTFYGGIEHDRTLFREVSKKKKPLPRFSNTMLATDIPTLLENSYRIALDTPLIAIDTIEPASFAGAKGVHFTFHFTSTDDEVRRKGEATAAIIGGKLYMITYEAPALHYFDTSVESFRQVVASAKLG